MKKNNLHMVPQPVIDCAENITSSRNPNTRDMYIVRLEAIRDYCDEVLKSIPAKPVFEDFNKKKPSTGKYSRVGRNNV